MSLIILIVKCQKSLFGKNNPLDYGLPEFRGSLNVWFLELVFMCFLTSDLLKFNLSKILTCQSGNEVVVVRFQLTDSVALLRSVKRLG